MSDRIQRADERVSPAVVIDTKADDGVAAGRGGHTLAIIESCHRIVKKDGSLSGARSCAASFGAAGRATRRAV
ncbi:MAG: hypothetical protein JWQ58_1394 [Reyranella sp.]|nr:hypothetical protein [Reyranella sp.]